MRHPRLRLIDSLPDDDEIDFGPFPFDCPDDPPGFIPGRMSAVSAAMLTLEQIEESLDTLRMDVDLFDPPEDPRPAA